LIDTAMASFPMGSTVTLMATSCLTGTCCVLYTRRIQPVLTGLLRLVWLRSVGCAVCDQPSTSIASASTLTTSYWV
jgi:hypothetical protein